MTVSECSEAILAISIIALPLIFFVHRTFARRADGRHFGSGVRTVQVLAVMTMPQIVALLALHDKIDGGIVGTLLGGAIGYLFGGLTDFDRNRTQ